MEANKENKRKETLVGAWMAFSLFLLCGEPQSESFVAFVLWYGFVIANLAGVAYVANKMERVKDDNSTN